MAKFRGIDPTIKVLAVPALAIVGSVIFALMIVLNGYPKIMNGVQNIQEDKKAKNTLNERLTILKDFSKGALDNKSNIVFTVLPNQNSGAGLLSQIKSLAISNGMVLTLVDSTGTDLFRSDITRQNVTFTFESKDMNSAVKFLQDMLKTAPISSIENADIEAVENGITLKLKVALYWSDLPAKLPSLDEPLTELSAKDRETLGKIQSYRLPQFVELKPQTQNQGRQNPFN